MPLLRGVVLLCFTALFCAGCQHPTVKTPLGTRWTAEEVAALDGWWATSKDNEVIRLKSTEDGEATLASVDWEKAEGKFQVFNAHAFFTRIGQHDFVFLQGRGFDTDYDGFCFGKVIRHDSGSIVVAYPDGEAFIDLVQSGMLNGEVHTGKSGRSKWAHLLSSANEFATAIEKRGVEECFDMKDSTQFVRIAPPSPTGSAKLPQAKAGEKSGATITTLQGDSLSGDVDLETHKREIERIAKEGEIEFEGPFHKLTDWVKTSGTSPLGYQVSGSVHIPGRGLSATYTYSFKNCLILHATKWRVKVLVAKKPNHQ